LCQEAFQLSNGASELSIFTLSLKNVTHKLALHSLKLFQQAYQASYSAFRLRRNADAPTKITFHLPNTPDSLSPEHPCRKKPPYRQRNPLPAIKKELDQ